MMAINVIPLLWGSLAISAMLIILSKLHVGLAGSAAAIIALCVILAFVEFRISGAGFSVRQAFQGWLIFLCVPSAVVFALSRAGILRHHAWLLVLAGPISFFLTVVVVVSVLNAYFPSIFRRP
jgi:hypothetical protein